MGDTCGWGGVGRAARRVRRRAGGVGRGGGPPARRCTRHVSAVGRLAVPAGVRSEGAGGGPRGWGFDGRLGGGGSAGVAALRRGASLSSSPLSAGAGAEGEGGYPCARDHRGLPPLPRSGAGATLGREPSPAPFTLLRVRDGDDLGTGVVGSCSL